MVASARVLVAIFSLLFLGLASATHFRFGTIQWSSVSGTPLTIQFRVDAIFRRSWGDWNSVKPGQTFKPGTFTFGNGKSTDLFLNCTAINLPDDYASGTAIITYTYPNVAKTYTVGHTSKGRLLSLINNGDAVWNFTATVTVNPSATEVYSSPVSSGLPIVAVTYNKVNVYQMPMSTPMAGRNLYWQLSTPQDLGTTPANPETQPNNLTISSSGSVTFDTRGQVAGLYNTQHKLYDNISGDYISIDYLINVTNNDIGVCSSDCSASGVSCTSDSDCGTCTGGNNGKCLFAFPFVSVKENQTTIATNPISPSAGSTLNWIVGQVNSLNLVATDLNIANPVYIYVGNIPTGSSISSQAACNSASSCSCTSGTRNCNSPQLVTLSWTPTLNSVGSYAVCFGVRQNIPIPVELSYSQHCVTINVSPPRCGAGSLSPTAPASCGGAGFDPKVCCTCPSGFDNSTSCTSCLDGFYGSSCTPCPNCNSPQGTCNDGISGTGTCTCSNGFAGLNCNVLVNSRCQSSQVSTVLSSSGVGTVFSPSNAALYMSILNNNTGSVYTAFTAKAPSSPVLDIVLLQDVSSGTTRDDLTALSNFITTFVTNLISSYPGSLVGLATFDGTSSNYRKYSSLTGDSESLRAYINSISINTNSAQSYVSSLEAAVSASGDSFGWRDTSFKTVVVLTSKPVNPNGLSVAAFSKLIAQNSVNPCFLFKGTTNPYVSLVSSLRFGSTNTLNTPQSNWQSQLNSELRSKLLQQYVAVATEDPYGFFQLGDGKTIASGASSTLNVQFAFNSSLNKNSFSVFPTISVAPIGWQSSKVLLNWNRSPVSTPATFTTIQDTPFNFTLTSTDADNNILTVSFPVLPTNGNLLLNNGTVVKSRVAYDVNALNLTFVNQLYWSGTTSFTFQTGDGCDLSNIATVSFIVKGINYPPKGQNFAVTVAEKNDANFSFSSYVSDVEDVASTLKVFIQDISGVSSGNLYDSAGKVLKSGSQVTGQSGVFVAPNIYWNGVVSFKYYVQDSNNSISSESYTVTITVTPVNDPPVITYSSNVLNCKIAVPCATSFTITDPDSDDLETTSIVNNNLTSVDKFTFVYNGAATDASTSGFTGTVQTNLAPVSTVILNFTSTNLARGELGGVYVKATDKSGADSNAVFFQVSITENTPPYLVERTPSNTTLYENQNISITIVGTDDDSVPQAQNVTLTISTGPSNGILKDSNGNTISGTVSLSLKYNPTEQSTGYHLTYVPNAYFYGTDSFSFVLKDFVGGVSLPYSVPLTVAHVNHPPTSSNFSVVALQNTPYSFSGFVGNDVDRDTPLFLIILELPAKGTLTYSDGSSVQINQPINSVTEGWRLVYTPPTNQWGVNFASISFTVNDGEVDADQSYLAIIDVTHVNQAPETQGGEYRTKQNTPLKIVLTATDVDDATPTLTGILTSLGLNNAPFGGSLYSEDPSLNPSATPLAVSSSFNISTGVWYVPTTGGYSDPDDSIYTSFSFQARDPAGLLSSVSTANFIVDWVNPGPIYTGVGVIDVFENSFVDVFLSGYNVRYPTETVRATITGNPDRGLLYCYEDGPGTPITYFNGTVPASVVAEDSNVRFAPVEYENGNNYTLFYFNLTDSRGVSNQFSIIVNVIPVNQAPVLYPGNLTATVYQNNDVIIDFTAWDRDSPLESLYASIARYPQRGALYTCLQSENGTCQRGNLIPSGTNVIVPRWEVAVWKVLFAPEKDQGAIVYATPAFVVRDDYNASSNLYTISIRVKRFNQPPTVAVVTPFETTTEIAIPLSNTTVADSDGGGLSEMVVVLAQTNGTLNVSADAFATSKNKKTPDCVLSEDKTNLTCVASLKILNDHLGGLTFTPLVAGNHTVSVTINDLGSGAEQDERATNHLTASSTITIVAVAPTVPVSGGKDMTAAFIGASVGGGLAAAAAVGVVARMIKKPDASVFDNMFSFEEGGVLENPLYVDAQSDHVNPIFENE